MSGGALTFQELLKITFGKSPVVTDFTASQDVIAGKTADGIRRNLQNFGGLLWRVCSQGHGELSI